MKEYTIQNWINKNTTKQELQKLALREDIKISWNQIRDKQWQAFNMALEMQLKAYKRKAEGKSDAWLKREIDKVQSWINDHVEMEQLYIENKSGDSKDIGDAIITGKAYKSIKNAYEDYETGKRATAIIEAKQGGEYSISRLFLMYVNKNYLQYLKSIINQSKKKSTYDNETKLNMIEKGKENEGAKKWTILKACEYIKSSSKEVDDLFNPENRTGDREPKAELYNIIFKRVPFLNKDNHLSDVRGYLRVAFRNGKFQDIENTMDEIEL